MSENGKTVSSINGKIREGKAVVVSDREFLEETRAGHSFQVSEIDVVTTAWQAAIGGTAVMFCVPVAKRGIFTRARSIWLNGVPGVPGPAPNERLGAVDTLIFAEQIARGERRAYDGARLFVDILHKETVEVEVLSEEGDIYTSTFTLDQLQFARMYIYNCFLGAVRAGAARGDLPPCPAIATGSTVLLNRAAGIVIGSGTRSRPGREALSLSAELFGMDPELMTAADGDGGVVIMNSIALAIPVLDGTDLKKLALWLSLNATPTQNPVSQDQDGDVARYLKELVIRGSFFLTDSDMPALAHDLGAAPRPAGAEGGRP